MARVARFLLYCLIIWLPLPLGSNRPVFWIVNGLVVSVILILFLAGEIEAGQNQHQRRLDWRPAVWALAGLGVWVVWMIFQALPGIAGVLHHPQWAFLGDAVGTPAGAVSINPSATWTTMAQVVPAILLSVVAMRLAVNPVRARFLLNIVVVATVSVAAYGLVAEYSGIEQVFLIDTVAYEGFLTGTFVNRNTAATFFAVGLACTAAMIVVPAEESAVVKTQARWILWDTVAALTSRPWYIAAFLILAVAIFNTGSRVGVVAGVTALLAVAILSAIDGRKTGRTYRVVVSLSLASVLVVFVLFSNVIIDRFKADLWSDGRLEVYQDTVDMIAARPILGHGAGTFADAFPTFHQRTPSSGVWNRAHNTYLQMAAELGLPVFAVVIACLVGTLVYLIVRLGRRSAASPVAIAAVAAALAAAVHSVFDFSVQFQAVGFTLAMLVGAGIGEVASTSTAGAGARHRSSPTGPSNVSHEKVRIVVPPASKKPITPVASPSLPDGLRVYAFGDVHGRYDLLLRLREAINRDRRDMPVKETLVIGLGDYIDRGPDSCDVVEALSSGFFECETVFLRGNHEQMLLDFLEDPGREGARWFHAGAAETLQSYVAADVDLVVGSRIPFSKLREELAAKVPPSHVVFLQKLPMSFEIGDYFFAHAGARPGTPLELQDPRDLLWIRDGFSDADAPFEKVVVHGHSPVDRPYFGNHRINIDTGAYFTNRLTCLVLEGAGRRVIEAHEKSHTIV